MPGNVFDFVADCVAFEYAFDVGCNFENSPARSTRVFRFGPGSGTAKKH